MICREKVEHSSLRLAAVKHGSIPDKDRLCSYSTVLRRTRRRTAVKSSFFTVLDGAHPSSTCESRFLRMLCQQPDTWIAFPDFRQPFFYAIFNPGSTLSLNTNTCSSSWRSPPSPTRVTKCFGAWRLTNHCCTASRSSSETSR